MGWKRWTALGVGALALAGAVAALAAASCRERAEPPTRRGASPAAPARDALTPHTIVFMVLDTVRAQNTSLCGYDRPTTPTLDKLVADGALHACRAYSPAPWTVPSHASYFSGLAVPEHGADRGATPFKTNPTLARALRQRGYQTLMVSGNPTLFPQSGLQRGFQHVVLAETLTELRGTDMAKRIRKALRDIDPDRPSFLFFNLFDAHDPYPEVPDDIDWVPRTPGTDLASHSNDPTAPFKRYVKGKMSEEQAARYVERLTNGYDFGIWRADRNVQRVMKLLEERGLLSRGYRFVLTSDHGEFLGEHGALRHCCFTWEEVTRVPFVYLDTTGPMPEALPEPFSATNAYFLALDGVLPDPPYLVGSVSHAPKGDFYGFPGADMASMWVGDTDKLHWLDGAYLRGDLGTDPGELDLKPLGAHPSRPTFEPFAEAQRAHVEASRDVVADPAVTELLRGLGYAE